MHPDRSPDFIEAIARGLDLIRCFDASRPVMVLSEVATATGLPRPTARRILITLEELGYVRNSEDGYMLTPRVVELGMAYIGSIDVWDIVRPHLHWLVEHTDESSSIAQLDGSDIVYVARVAVPKLVALQVTIGTRFPALQTSLGKVLLAALSPDELHQTLAIPSRSGLEPSWHPDRAEIDRALDEARTQDWAMTDQQLSHSIRSIAAPIRDGNGKVVAAVNVNSHAGETSVETLIGHHLPLLLTAASAISDDWAALQQRSIETVDGTRRLV